MGATTGGPVSGSRPVDHTRATPPVVAQATPQAKPAPKGGSATPTPPPQPVPKDPRSQAGQNEANKAFDDAQKAAEQARKDFNAANGSYNAGVVNLGKKPDSAAISKILTKAYELEQAAQSEVDACDKARKAASRTHDQKKIDAAGQALGNAEAQQDTVTRAVKMVRDKYPAQIPHLTLNPDGTVKGGKETLVPALLAKNPGLFFGDSHGTIDVIDTFKEILPTLKASGVQTLYVEMVPSADQSVLDRFQKDGDTKALKEFLIKAGWDIGQDGKWVDHLVTMLAEARNNGIKLYGIDEQGSGKLPQSSRTARANPHWAEVINNTQPKRSGKYVIFGGAGHSANYPANKGVNVLLGIPSITPYTKGDAYYDRSVHGDDASVLTKMPDGTVAPNPNPNESDFVYVSRQ